MPTERERQEFEICLATTTHKFDERDCARLIAHATGREVPVPKDGEDFDLLEDLTDEEIGKVHAVVMSWDEPCSICGVPKHSHDDEECRGEYES